MDFTAMSNSYIQRVMENVNQKFSYKRYGQNTKLHIIDTIQQESRTEQTINGASSECCLSIARKWLWDTNIPILSKN